MSHSSHYAIIPRACLKFMICHLVTPLKGRAGCRIVTRPLFLSVRGGVWARDYLAHGAETAGGRGPVAGHETSGEPPWPTNPVLHLAC